MAIAWHKLQVKSQTENDAVCLYVFCVFKSCTTHVAMCELCVLDVFVPKVIIIHPSILSERSLQLLYRWKLLIQL